MSDASTLFDLLAAGYRRRILLLLCDQESIDVPDALVTRGEAGTVTTLDGVTPETVRDRERVDVALYHRHLPKLADEGVIEWDDETGTVTRGPAFGEIEPALRVLAENADRFPSDLL